MKSIKWTNFLGFLVSLIGVIGALAGIFAGFGTYGIIAFIFFLLLLILTCYKILKPVVLRNQRGVTLLEAIDIVGLVDIENRNNLERALPPAAFYNEAKREIVISAITAFRTFDQNLSLIMKAIDDGKKVFILIMHPKSQDIEFLQKREAPDIKSQLNEVINQIKKEELYKKSGFQIRFMQRLPFSTSVMIDGDLSPLGLYPKDQEGQIRVQPGAVHKTQHSGVIMQFRKKDIGKEAGVFDYFAQNLRKEWDEGLEDTEIFSQHP